MICWCRLWHSRASRFQRLAARYRDIGVLTDRQLMLFEVGMFSRLPRRRVLVDRLDELTVEDVSRAKNGTKVRFGKPGHKMMLIECRRGNSFGRRLLETAGRRVVAPDPSGTEPNAPGTSGAPPGGPGQGDTGQGDTGQGDAASAPNPLSQGAAS